MHKVRNDVLLIVGLLVIMGIGILCTFLFSSKKDIMAYVYYDDTLVLKIDLDKEDTYTVIGEVGELEIKVKDKALWVSHSTCPDRICVHQGKISKKNQTITCLPNKIYICIEQAEEGVDIVV